MRVCIHTASGSAHGRTMGGRCQNCQTPTPTSVGQRAPKRRRAGGSASRNRGGDELVPVRSDQQRPKRRRGADSRAPADRRAAARHTSTPDPGPGRSKPLEAMAACLVSQASVLAEMVLVICLGPTNSGQVAPEAAEHPRRRSRRGQPIPQQCLLGESYPNIMHE